MPGSPYSRLSCSLLLQGEHSAHRLRSSWTLTHMLVDAPAGIPLSAAVPPRQLVPDHGQCTHTPALHIVLHMSLLAVTSTSDPCVWMVTGCAAVFPRTAVGGARLSVEMSVLRAASTSCLNWSGSLIKVKSACRRCSGALTWARSRRSISLLAASTTSPVSGVLLVLHSRSLHRALRTCTQLSGLVGLGFAGGAEITRCFEPKRQPAKPGRWW